MRFPFVPIIFFLFYLKLLWYVEKYTETFKTIRKSTGTTDVFQLCSFKRQILNSNYIGPIEVLFAYTSNVMVVAKPVRISATVDPEYSV